MDEAYRKVLETSRLKGAVEELPPKQERRGNPRIRLPSATREAGAAVRSYVIDISASGASVCSREPAREGDSLYAKHGDAGPVQLSVVDCRFSDFDHEMMVTYYRLNCEFDNETEGKQLLVQVIEQGQQDLRLEMR